MPIRAILNHHTVARSLCVMEPAAWYFFLPGFMLVQLDYPKSDVNVVNELAPPEKNLSAKVKDTPYTPPKDMAAVREATRMLDKAYPRFVRTYQMRISCLTLAQRRACVAFLNSLKPASDSEERRAIKALSSSR